MHSICRTNEQKMKKNLNLFTVLLITLNAFTCSVERVIEQKYSKHCMKMNSCAFTSILANKIPLCNEEGTYNVRNNDRR